MPGRPRKPTKLHLLQGTAQPCRMEAQGRDLEPQVEEPLPDPPEWLSEGAKRQWNAIASVSPWLRITDEPTVRIFCLASDQIDRVAKAGEEITPAMLTSFKVICQALGFTPADRAKMRMPVVEKPTNKFAKLGS